MGCRAQKREPRGSGCGLPTRREPGIMRRLPPTGLGGSPGLGSRSVSGLCAAPEERHDLRGNGEEFLAGSSRARAQV